MAPAAEAEAAALLAGARELLPARAVLAELGHPQPPTLLCTDSNTAHGIINGIFKQGRSKAIGMRFYWLAGRVQQGQLSARGEGGKKSLAGYFTKHHPPSHHRQVRPMSILRSHPVASKGVLSGLAGLRRIQTATPGMLLQPIVLKLHSSLN